MPQVDWQSVAALAAVAAAAVYIACAVRNAVRKRRSAESACGSGSCGGCAASTGNQPQIKEFVPLDTLSRRP